MNAVAIDFVQQRLAMVDCQLRTFDILDHGVLARMLEVPRENFVPDNMSAVSYSDRPIDVARGGIVRTILPPMFLGRMLQVAEITKSDRVLDIAGADGYSAAVEAGLAGEVVALEANEEFAAAARDKLVAMGIDNVRTTAGDLADGYAAGAPFDVIIVNGAIEIEPARLLGQLAEGGRLVAIFREADDPTGMAAKVHRFVRTGEQIGRHEEFGAAAPVLPGFAAEKGFTF